MQMRERECASAPAFKRFRGDTIARLEDAFAMQPLPNTAQRNELALMLGITARQVQVWFQNKRQRTNRLQGHAEVDAPKQMEIFIHVKPPNHIMWADESFLSFCGFSLSDVVGRTLMGVLQRSGDEPFISGRAVASWDELRQRPAGPCLALRMISRTRSGAQFEHDLEVEPMFSGPYIRLFRACSTNIRILSANDDGDSGDEECDDDAGAELGAAPSADTVAVGPSSSSCSRAAAATEPGYQALIRASETASSQQRVEGSCGGRLLLDQLRGLTGECGLISGSFQSAGLSAALAASFSATSSGGVDEAGDDDTTRKERSDVEMLRAGSRSGDLTHGL